jgi:hypothetical protein
MPRQLILAQHLMRMIFLFKRSLQLPVGSNKIEKPFAINQMAFQFNFGFNQTNSCKTAN